MKLRLVISLAVLVAAAQAQSDPAIEFTAVPRFGSMFGVVSGRALNVTPARYRVAVFIYLDSQGWFSKPTCAQTTVPIASDGTWSAETVTGGSDAKATEIRAYLLPVTFTQACVLEAGGIPETTERAAVARVVVHRPDPDARVVLFAAAAGG
jgi:hypothetical protein